MDLGSLNFRYQGVNSLLGAVHPDNGVVWTDGRGIFLTQISVSTTGHLENQEHNKLGEFDRGVKAIFWSDTISESLCCMCVVHEKNISIWRVEGQQPKLNFKQIRKVNIQPIPQGCLWNPGRDILCVLCPQQASLYYSHTHNKGSQVLLQLDSREKIKCGCWLTDGSTLVVCAGTSLRVFFWSDVNGSINQYTTVHWSVTGLTGRISAIVPVSSSRVIYASELPLDSLCKQQDVFTLPDLLTTNTKKPIGEASGDDVIRPQEKQQSVIDSLLNIPRNKHTVIDWSCMVCVELQPECDPRLVEGCKVSGILTPDLLLYQPVENLLVVGSNNQTVLQVFSIDGGNSFTPRTQIILEKDERPKGLASCPRRVSLGEPRVLILVGQTNKSDNVFPSSSNTVSMKSFLKLFHSKHGHYDKNPLSHTRSTPSIPVSVATNGQQMSSSDYETITHSVLNFDTNISSSSETSLQNKGTGSSQASLYRENGSNISSSQGSLYHKDNDSTASLQKTDSVDSESGLYDRVNGARAANGADMDRPGVTTDKPGTKVDKAGTSVDKPAVVAENRADAELPAPPKRPVRKKRSFRSKSSLPGVSTGSSNTSKSSDPLARMAMEYQSDSPEVSPRGSEAGDLINSSAPPAFIKPVTIKPVQNSVHSESRKTVDTSGKRLDPVIEPVDGNHGNSDSADKRVPSPDQLSDSGICLSIQPDVQQNGHKRIVEIGDTGGSGDGVELEVERTEFTSQKSCFNPLDVTKVYEGDSVNDFVMQEFLGRKMKTKESKSLSLESLEDIDRILKEQNEKISKLQEHMNKLCRRVDESCCVLPSRYQSMESPEFVHISFRCKDGFEIKKKFLLDNGRLQLQQVKRAFSLEMVEIDIDGEPCVTGCNIDGYIPMRFTSGSVVYISGTPALS